MRSRISYANVASTLALFFALGGSAVAARHYIITSVDQIRPNVRAQLEHDRGPVGPRGPAGPVSLCGEGLACEGEHGPAGPTGPTGQTERQGPTGPRGAPGYPGPEGPQGNPGLKGSDGLTGPTGPTGAASSAAVVSRAVSRYTGTLPIAVSAVEPYEPMHDGQGRYGSITLKGVGLEDTKTVVAYEMVCGAYPWPCLRQPMGFAAEHFAYDAEAGSLHVQLAPLAGKTVDIEVRRFDGGHSEAYEASYTFAPVVRVEGWAG